MTTSTTSRARSRAPLVAALVAASYFVAALAAIFSGRIPPRARYDQLLYHEPVIRGFLKAWPTFDFYDYLSATTPGYHLLLATVARLFSASTTALQITSAVIGAALVGTVAAACMARTTAGRAVAFTAPVACSLYVFISAAWLLPDNLAWLGVTLILLSSLRTTFSTRCAAVGSLLLVALVLTRQIHLWAAAPLWAAAFLRPAHPDDLPASTLADTIRSHFPTRLARTFTALAFTLPAFILIALFARLWGGLTPPRFHLQYASINTASVPFFLAVFGVLSCFFLPTLLPRLLELTQNRRRLTLVVIATFLAAVIPPTNFDYYAGRRTGLWNVVQKLPVIAGHTSPLILVLAILGGLALAAWLTAFDLRRRIILLVALAGFWSAQAASVELWQRYVEPFALILLAIFASQAAGLRTPNPDAPARSVLFRRAEMAFPLALAVAFAALNIRSLINAPLIADGPPGIRAADDASDTPAPTEVVVPPKAKRGLWW